MGANIRLTDTEVVPMILLFPHPENARRGDVDKIADSLNHHGQYKPIVVNRRNHLILAGNHTFLAAKKLKWRNIGVVWVDVDEVTEKKILIVDNRTTDLSSYNEPALKFMLEDLPDLEGTGFNLDDLGMLDELLNQPFEPDNSSVTPPQSDDDEYKLNLFTFKATIEAVMYEAWRDDVLEEAGQSKPRAVQIIKDRLKIPQPEPRIRKDPSTLLSPPDELKTSMVDINQLHTYPHNPREGDIGAIADSLATLGQYRPIVARKDGTILAGNHTYQAAKALGWEKIAVTYITCTDDEASRIVLVDNRTSDYGSYDTDALKRLITSLPDWKGTGYDASDVSELLGGGAPKASPNTTSTTNCRIGDFSFRSDKPTMARWSAGLTLADVAERLGIPDFSLTAHEFGADQSRVNTSQWKKLRQQTLVRDDYKCHYCGGTANEIDHKTSYTNGGTDEPSNLVATCTPCNRAKGANNDF